MGQIPISHPIHSLAHSIDLKLLDLMMREFMLWSLLSVGLIQASGNDNSATEEFRNGCLPVKHCRLKLEDCSGEQFRAYVHMGKFLCCTLDDNWDQDKEVFDWHAIKEAAGLGEDANNPQGRLTAPVIKLVGGTTSNGGNVLVDGKPVCDDYWDTKDAKVVCRMLGYTGGDVIIESAYGPTGVDFAMDDVQCNGNEHTISDCPHLTNSNCADGEAAGVQCVSSAGLVGGPTAHEGNVLINGRPVCDDYWDNNDATVVCRMLGYGSGIAVQDAAYGPVEGKFLINNVDCKGTEANIHQCTKSNAHKCHGPEGAGVICIPEGNSGIKCPGNWDMAGTGCYHISSEAMSWPKAKWYCEQRHGFLAEIKKKYQHDDLLQDFVATAEIGASGVWIGLNDRVTEDEFRWANSGEHLQFAQWNTNEPANTENDDCVFMTADHKWNNNFCQDLKPALCQRRYIFA